MVKQNDGKVVPLHTIKAYRGSRGRDPLTVNLGTRWRWLVCLTPRLLYPWVNSPDTYWLGGWVGPSKSEHSWEEVNSPARIWIPDHPAFGLVTIITTWSWLHCKTWERIENIRRDNKDSLQAVYSYTCDLISSEDLKDFKFISQNNSYQQESFSWIWRCSPLIGCPET
jgi:hypothetical protein